MNEAIDSLLDSVALDDSQQSFRPPPRDDVGKQTADVTFTRKRPQAGLAIPGLEIVLGKRLPIEVAEERQVESRVIARKFATEFGKLALEPGTQAHVVFQHQKCRRMAAGKLAPQGQMAEGTADEAAAIAEIIAAEGVLQAGRQGERAAVDGGKPLDPGGQIAASHLRHMATEGFKPVHAAIEVDHLEVQVAGEALTAKRAGRPLLPNGCRRDAELGFSIQVIGIGPGCIAAFGGKPARVQTVDAIEKARRKSGAQEALAIVMLEMPRRLIEWPNALEDAGSQHRGAK